MKTTFLRALAVALCLASAAVAQPQPPAPADPPRPKGPARLDFGLAFSQIVSTSSFSSTQTIREYAEDGTFGASYEVKGAPGAAFDLQYHFTEKFGLRASFQASSRKSDGEFTASLPHPFFFSRPRSAAGTVTGLGFQEKAYALTAVFQRTGDWGVSFEAGPAFFSVNATLADSMRTAQVYPYDTVAFEGVVSSKKKVSPVGFAAGLSLSRRLGPSVDAVVGANFTTGSGMVSIGGRDVSVKAGGLQARAGLRIVVARKKAE